MRAVLDTNVLISAVLSRSGAPAQLLELWLGGAFELVTSPKLLEELERVLAYPKIRSRVSEEEAEALVSLIAVGSITVADPTEFPSVRSRDPDDDFLISLAAQSRSILVSGAPDLLDLADQIPVSAPAGFLGSLTSA